MPAFIGTQRFGSVSLPNIMLNAERRTFCEDMTHIFQIIKNYSLYFYLFFFAIVRLIIDIKKYLFLLCFFVNVFRWLSNKHPNIQPSILIILVGNLFSNSFNSALLHFFPSSLCSAYPFWLIRRKIAIDPTF